jgi:hypothetical protein
MKGKLLFIHPSSFLLSLKPFRGGARKGLRISSYFSVYNGIDYGNVTDT